VLPAMDIAQGLVAVGKSVSSGADVVVESDPNLVDDLNDLLISVDAEI
jgi:hypothetical protein